MKIFRLLLIFLMATFSLALYAQEWGRDPFQPPEGESKITPPPVPTAIEEEMPSDLILSGTLTSPKKAVAIINEKIVREGESIAGFKVFKIERKRVILTREGKSYSLYLGQKREVKENNKK
ncbi:MAG: general secretion pathway protein GspB [Caldiserica bacterium]|nr:general secretion pathway protein GspB [Caldisericota bacterium]